MIQLQKCKKEPIMGINTENITTEVLAKLQEKLIHIREKYNFRPQNFWDESHFDGVIAFLYHVKSKNKYLLKALREVGLIDSDKVSSAKEAYTSNEKRIATIAMNDQLKAILYKGKPRIAGNSEFLEQHLFAVYGFPEQGTRYIITKTYNKFKRRIYEKLARIKANKDVLALAQKHPDIDITRLVSYGVVSEKMDYTKEDLAWLEKMIEIIKQGNKQ